ncbi:MAG: TonB-dependent receptor plug domain-containing protein [Rhodospirillales bacterium]|nr:TonB-dependent receptor plug domain-containing protein [Rhodospirillales bacterium]
MTVRECAPAARLLVAAVVLLSFAAAESEAQNGAIEEVVVTAATGSRIVRQGDSPSPLSNYDSRILLDSGLKDIRDLVGVLSINAGAENNSDNLTRNHTVGTANINLRGLGVASTLVLLNGRRQVLSAAQTDDGSSFVGLAGLVPMLAIERVEILGDGAAATRWAAPWPIPIASDTKDCCRRCPATAPSAASITIRRSPPSPTNSVCRPGGGWIGTAAIPATSGPSFATPAMTSIAMSRPAFPF